MNTKNILSVKNLKKIYSSKETGATHALSNLNLDVKEFLDYLVLMELEKQLL